MSDQVYDDSSAQDSHQADIDAGFDNVDDSTSVAGVVPGSEVPEEQDATSHEADVEAGYDDDDAHTSDDDRRLGLR